MHDLTPQIAALLRSFVRDPSASIAAGTRLADLAIDFLDLPMILLEVEDTFDIHFGTASLDLATVGDLAAAVIAALAVKGERTRLAASAPRKRSSWMTTGARHRRAA